MLYEKKQRKILKKQKTYENFRQQLQVRCMLSFYKCFLGMWLKTYFGDEEDFCLSLDIAELVDTLFFGMQLVFVGCCLWIHSFWFWLL